MIRAVESILLFSDNPRKLTEFYKNKVGLKLTMEMEMGEDNEEGFSFEKIGGCNLFIGHHSKIKDMNKQPQRMMFNLEVDNIEKEVTRLKKAKVKLVQDIYHVEGYGKIATFADADGNYFQFVQIRG